MKKDSVHLPKTVRTILVIDNPFIPGVMRELLTIADRQNIVHLNSFRSKTILKKMRIKNNNSSVIRKNIVNYIKYNYLVRVAESTYMINPIVAFNCSNSEFIRLHEDYERYIEIALSNKPKGKIKKIKKISPVDRAKNILNNSEPFE